MNYPITNHKLEFSSDFGQVIVLETTNCTVAGTFSLSASLRVEIVSGAFVLTANTAVDGFSESFAMSEADQVRFDGNRLIGVTDVRVDSFRSVHTYELDECPVGIKQVGTGLEILGPCTPGCTGPLPSCCTVTTYQPVIQ